jgi:hypothetical protein
MFNTFNNYAPFKALRQFNVQRFKVTRYPTLSLTLPLILELLKRRSDRHRVYNKESPKREKTLPRFAALSDSAHQW